MYDLPYGYCGMPCALCNKYRTEGKSKCMGCSSSGFFTGSCNIYKCCKNKSNIACATCNEFPCEKHNGLKEFSDLNTDCAWNKNCESISQKGFDGWYKEYKEKSDLLTIALKRYNNGRMKKFLCELFIQRDLNTLRLIMNEAEALQGTPKEIAIQFKQIANYKSN